MTERFLIFIAIGLLNCLKPVWNSWTCFNLFFQQLSRFGILAVSAHIETHVYALVCEMLSVYWFNLGCCHSVTGWGARFFDIQPYTL